MTDVAAKRPEHSRLRQPMNYAFLKILHYFTDSVTVFGLIVHWFLFYFFGRAT